MFTAHVVRTRRLSPSFQRVTVAGPDLADFEYQGLDHWFRLFLPTLPGRPLRLPRVEGRSWWQPYLDIPEDVRPHCSNYTVAAVRHGAGVDDLTELDVDVVLHDDEAGELCGAVALWATTCGPGDPLALLDQGVLFDPPEDAGEVVLVGDETGMPGLRGIVRDLPAGTRGRVLVEVPRSEDVEEWAAPEGLDVVWLPRDGRAGRPGELALATLREGPAPRPDAYACVVGESALATGGRRWLVGEGLSKERIFFSGYYRVDAG
ncbi:siderophore-interacting protein [Nocardioides sp. GY 10127]|nr:siderophore-interacting protein [Nocardioides sp. GY 10127]